MTALMMIAAMVPMSATSYCYLRVSSASVSGNELKNLEGLAQSTAGRVSQLVVDNRTFADYLSSDPRFIDYLKAPAPAKAESLTARMKLLADGDNDVELMFLMDHLGNDVVSSDPRQVGQNFSFANISKRP